MIKITTLQIVYLFIFILFTSFIGIFAFEIYDIKKNFLYIYPRYTYVLEHVGLSDKNGKGKNGVKFGANRLAELTKYRRYIANLGNKKYDIQISDMHWYDNSTIKIYINNKSKNLFEITDIEKITAEFRNYAKETESISNLQIIKGDDNSIKMNVIVNPSLNILNKNIYQVSKDIVAISYYGILFIKIPLKNSDNLRLEFSYGERNNVSIMSKGTLNKTREEVYFKNIPFGKKIIFWWYGIKYDQKMVDKNLIF